MKESKFYQEILAEGQAEGQQAFVIEALQERFGSQAVAEFEQAIANVYEPEQLSRLHRLAIRCRSLAQFRRELRSLTLP